MDLASNFNSEEEAASGRLLAVHGLGVDLDSRVEWLSQEIERVLGEFAVDALPAGVLANRGIIRQFEEGEVLRHVSPTAKRLDHGSSASEIYVEDERFWLVDERWGLVEMNLLKGHWRSWVLPQAAVQMDAVRCVELAVLWPMAQVLRNKGLHLVSAASVVRGRWSALVISPTDLEPELRAMLHAGFRVVGQRWTALREEDGRVAMLRVPGRVERAVRPRLRLSEETVTEATEELSPWVDLAGEHYGSERNHAFCNTVLLVEPRRRPEGLMVGLSHGAAINRLRRRWPILELHPTRKAGRMASLLARQCRSFEVHLSREPSSMLDLMTSFAEQSEAGGMRGVA